MVLVKAHRITAACESYSFGYLDVLSSLPQLPRRVRLGENRVPRIQFDDVPRGGKIVVMH